MPVSLALIAVTLVLLYLGCHAPDPLDSAEEGSARGTSWCSRNATRLYVTSYE